ncbi:glycosyltransferase [Laspinema olomoucense]|uniref:glycosyltransferase n=1 Tax=Laspinema olomoucense TaxID=3231600 RepID=UPI0021BAD5DD|nr:glycosyltransferase [Laspinema sp. D3a]MCT7990059.1 glycosyltransferase [Laspinema sp. D3a]
MKKLAFIIRSLDRGGAERQVVTLAKYLPKSQYKIYVFCYYAGGKLERELQEHQVEIIDLKKGGRWDVIGFFSRLLYEMRRINPDIVHGYMGPNLLTIFLKPFLPATQIVWGIRTSYLDFSQYDWFWQMEFNLECWLSRFADLIIANSYAGQEHRVAHGFPSERMMVIPNGIDLERFKPDAEARLRVRTEWGITENTILIGFVARLDPIKDHPTFLQAVDLLCQKRQDVCFVCVGGGAYPEYAKTLEPLAEQLGVAAKVIWAGEHSDMSAVYNALDIATSSSYGEGFPNAVAEAMACGVPCVVTDVGDSAKIVGDTGIVVPPKNPAVLANGWKKCLEMDAREIGIKARARIVKNFKVENLVKRTQDALEKLPFNDKF